MDFKSHFNSCPLNVHDAAEYNRNQYIFLLRCFMWKVMLVLNPEEIKK